jgi:hypothetical protein
MFEVTVKWSDGCVAASSPYSREEADAIANFLWAAGADDVKITCACNNCETCSDYAAWGA